MGQHFGKCFADEGRGHTGSEARGTLGSSLLGHSNSYVFLDCSKAFGTADHGILLDKLDHFGIRGCALSWLKSYLSYRTQYVIYTRSELKRQMIKCGAPQGSTLGLLLLLIYINDLCTICKNDIPVPFADGTNLFSSGLDATGIRDGVNHDLAIITEWLKANEWIPNIKKTHHTSFSAKIKQNKIKADISLKIDGDIIVKVTSSNFLGASMINWFGKSMCHLYTEKLLVA